ncbi:hypothetical protein CFAM422_000338 [Trichoderma lentiforme]|uniref:Uncharacterized protein n=1 Tax=Trichoderma lentiforme TaxID=1567552 RepID=A0A9P5CH02_9HYPO|nr:hypothetical protein CFAM422_000338 [Trichoderma lentiforme]
MDPPKMSSGVPTLLLLATVQAGKTLHETTIRDLRSELESLIGVLEALKSIVTDERPNDREGSDPYDEVERET